MRSIFAYSLLACVVLASGKSYDEEDQCEVEYVTVYGTAPTKTANIAGIGADSVGSTPAVSGAVVHDTAHHKHGDHGHGHHNHGADHIHPSSAAVALNDDSIKSHVHASSHVAVGAASASATASSSPSTQSSSADESSALSLPKRPDGQPPLPINDDHIKAPVADDAVPKDAVYYKPSTPGVFDCKDFEGWTAKLKANPPGSKWMKVEPGTYRFKLGPVMAPGTDANTVPGENIAIGFMPGGWTLDLRGVTFVVDITSQNKNQRPGVLLYFNQSENFTLLGGTVWVDQGELWSQARVTAVGAVDSTGNQAATFEVEEGYNVSVWRTANARNQFCVDDSNPNHYTRPGCNFWKVENYDFGDLDSSRTFKATLLGGSSISKGIVITMQLGIQSLFVVSTENNGNFVVKGMTTNGGFMSIGLNGKVPPKVSDYYYVNPPPRPGFAPRVQGPTINWGNIAGFDYVPPGQAPTDFSNSFWQYTGCAKDLWAGSDNGSKPPGL